MHVDREPETRRKALGDVVPGLAAVGGPPHTLAVPLVEHVPEPGCARRHRGSSPWRTGLRSARRRPSTSPRRRYWRGATRAWFPYTVSSRPGPATTPG